MAVTAKIVYNAALVLIDEVLENGNIVADQPKYYEAKARSILTSLQTELLPPSIDPVIITDLSQEMLVSDRVSLTILPYGLAAHLLVQEDTNAASFYNARYDEMKRKSATTATSIYDVYNVLGGMR